MPEIETDAPDLPPRGGLPPLVWAAGLIVVVALLTALALAI